MREADAVSSSASGGSARSWCGPAGCLSFFSRLVLFVILYRCPQPRVYPDGPTKAASKTPTVFVSHLAHCNTTTRASRRQTQLLQKRNIKPDTITRALTVTLSRPARVPLVRPTSTSRMLPVTHNQPARVDCVGQRATERGWVVW